jgi:hypothetical protein
MNPSLVRRIFSRTAGILSNVKGFVGQVVEFLVQGVHKASTDGRSREDSQDWGVDDVIRNCGMTLRFDRSKGIQDSVNLADDTVVGEKAVGNNPGISTETVTVPTSKVQTTRPSSSANK